MMGLTMRQAEALAAIKRLTVDGVAPTYNDIGAELGLASKAAVHRVIHQLAERGAITMLPGKRRSICVSGVSAGWLNSLSSADLREFIAHSAGILAHRDGDGGAQMAAVLHRVADRLTGQPRRAA